MSAEPSATRERRTLGKYHLLEELGHGGMATVYRAHDPRLGRDVAIKVIHRHLRENAEVAARFAAEARAVAKLRHPNIVEVYDVSGEEDPERWLVVELVRGRTLRRLLEQRGRLPVEIAVALALEVGSALQHAHEQGVVHRDVKPENVLVAVPEGVRVVDEEDARARDSSPRAANARPVKIADFGIAKLLDAQGVTSTGQVLGSPAHMAPEQIEGGEVGPRADVFGLGVLLYECLVGRLPFDGKNPAQVLRKVLDGSFTPAERALPRVGSRIGAVVARALAHDAAQRWGSVRELSEALRGELLRLGITDPERELSEWLERPEAHAADLEARVIARLVELGAAERRRGATAEAAADWNRALAYRPDDPDLLRKVAELMSQSRRRRVAVRVGVVVGAAAASATVAFVVMHRLTPKPELQADDPAVAAGSARPPGIFVAPPTPVADPVPRERTPVRERRPLPAPVAKPPAPPETRQVQIQVNGVKSGKVLVDGREIDWFGRTHELAVGPHVFQIVPPNTECCRAPGPERREVVAGTGTQLLVFQLPFKDAVLSVPVLPPGGSVSCALLFGGALTQPGSRSVPMRSSETRGQCLLATDSTTLAKEVTLRPGQTTVLGWP